MIIALTVAYDEGTFAVHYSAANTLETANRWCDERKANLAQQAVPCSSAVFNTDHIHWIDDCNVDEPTGA